MAHKAAMGHEQWKHSVPAKVKEELEFWNFGFWEEVEIFLISGWCYPMRKGYISWGEVSSFSVHFLIFKCKISKFQKIFASGTLIFNIHIFRFKTDAGLQVDIDFNTESKFSFSKSSFYSSLSGH